MEWVLGDLDSVAGKPPVDLVVMTGHAFQVFVDDDQIRDALSAIHAALRDGGRFAFETRNPTARAWERWRPELVETATDASGAVVTMCREVEHPVVGDRVRFTHTFTSSRWDGPRTSTSTLRFLGRAALNGFLADAGFRVARQVGDWNGGPLVDASPEIITIADRA